MGITNLWTLLDAVGRQITIESLQTQRIAVDASIWLIQFVKGMRDENGNMQKSAHLLGTFRRVCKLLFHKIHPIFVFDGGKPILKLKTLEKRRRARDNVTLNLQQTAQRLYLTQLKKQMHIENGKKQACASTFRFPEESLPVKRNVQEKVVVQEEILVEESEESDLEVPEGVIDRWMDEKKETFEVDVEAIAALPPAARKEFIDRVQREHRVQARATFLPLAGKPEEYSLAQISTFLSRSRLNQKLKATKGVHVENGMGGSRIASDASRRFILTQPNESFDSDVEESKNEVETLSTPMYSFGDDGSSIGDSSRVKKAAPLSAMHHSSSDMEILLSEDQELQQAIELSLVEARGRKRTFTSTTKTTIVEKKIKAKPYAFNIANSLLLEIKPDENVYDRSTPVDAPSAVFSKDNLLSSTDVIACDDSSDSQDDFEGGNSSKPNHDF